MTSSFDPYYTWLGIPPEEQPPNHYRLLGLKVLETNLEAISNAADRQTMLLRTYQTGSRSTLSQKLLNEIAAARVCLLNADKKAAYDAQLRQQLGQQPAASTSADGPPSSFNIRLTGSERDRILGRSRSGKSSSKPSKSKRDVQAAVVAAIATSLLAIGVGIFLLSNLQQEADLTNDSSSTETVAEIRPPVLAPIPDRQIRVGQAMELNVTVEDPGGEEALTFRLEQPVPRGMRIDRMTGQICWQPGTNNALGEYPVTVAVIRNAVGNPSSQQSFRIRLEASSELAEPEAGQVADEATSRSTTPDDSSPSESKPDEAMSDETEIEPAQPTTLADVLTTEESPKAHPVMERQPVPDKLAREQALSTIEKRFEKAYGNSKRHVRLALAAQLIAESRKGKDSPTERYVMLDEARNLAIREGDLVLGTIAVEELARHFQLDKATLEAEVLHAAIRQAKTPAALAPSIDAAFALAREEIAAESFDEVQSMLRVVASAAAKLRGTNLGKSAFMQQKLVQYARQMYEDSRTAAAAIADDPSDAEANLALGRFHCLAAEDWKTGLALLAQSSDEYLKAPAARLVADSSDSAAQLALADAWWKMAEEIRGNEEETLLLQNAARHWYSEAASRLAGADLTRAQLRLFTDGPPSGAALQPYQLSLRGLAGQVALLPEEVTGKVTPAGGFASFLGNGRIDYPRVPAVSYICEFELTFAKPQGTFKLCFGTPQRGTRIAFEWQSKESVFLCRVHKYNGRGYSWRGSRRYRAGETLRFTYYVNEGDQTLYLNDGSAGGAKAPPADLQLSIYAGDDVAVNLSHCSFRPWTAADAQTRKCKIRPSRVQGNKAETALQWHARNVDLDDRPNINTPEPFVVGTTGTPMQWVSPGTFQRTYSNLRDPRSPTDVTVTQGFWIGRYEVTQAEWARLMPNATSRATGSPFLPVNGVAWKDAAAFCMLLTERERKERRLPNGYLYRLPTEAEWELACRADSKEDFCTGENDFWSKERSDWHPHEVGTSTPNAWEIFDMHGNVAEWTCEMWHDIPAKSPLRLVDPFRPPADENSFLCWRGGNWWQSEPDLSSSARDRDRSQDPGYTGFRILLGPILQPK